MGNVNEPNVADLNFDDVGVGVYDEPEVVYLKDGDGIPDVDDGDGIDPEVEKLRLENEELKRKADVGTSIHSALVELGNKPAQAAPVVSQEPQKTAAEIAEELSEQMLVDPVGATEKIIEKYTAPKFNAIYNTAFKLAKKNAANDPTYKEYGGEVEAYIKALPLAHQNNPEVYEYAIQQIKNKHIDDIIKKQVEQQIAAMSGSRATPNVQPVGGGNFVPGGNGMTVPKVNKKKIYLTANDKFRLEEQSKRSGIPYRILEEDFIANKGGR